MKTPRVWLALVLLSALTCRAGSPEDAAAWLKKTIAPCFSEDSDVSLKARGKIETSGVAPELKKLLAKDNAEVEKTGEIGKLGFDWVLNAQDIPTDWEVKEPLANEKDVVVPVVTKWGDGNIVHFFLLSPSGKGWVIANVWYPKGSTLLDILK
jgi:hypothetical protein